MEKELAVLNALFRGIGKFVLAAFILPVGIGFLGYLIYIAVMTICELRK